MSRDQQPQYGTGGWQPMPQPADGDPDATAFVQLPPEAFPDPDPGAPLAAPGHGYVPPPIAVPATDPGETGRFQVPVPGAESPAGPGPEEYGQEAAYGPDAAYGPGPGGREEGGGAYGGPRGRTGAGGFGQAGMRAVAESRRAAMAQGYGRPEGGGPEGGRLESGRPDGGPEGGAGEPYGAPAETGGAGAAPDAAQDGVPGWEPDAGAWPAEPAHASYGAQQPGHPPHGDLPPGPAPHPADREGPPVEGRISAWRPVQPGERTAPSWAIPSAAEDLPEDSGEYALHDRSTAAEPADGGAKEHTAPPEPAAPEPSAEPSGEADAETGVVEEAEPEAAPAAVPPDEHPLASYVLRVNGADRPVTGAWIGESLLYVLRERLGLAGAKDGCSQGECGACSVKVDGRLVAACLVPAATAAGAEIRTVEGLADQGVHSDVQRALAASGAVQCGFCVPGLAMTVHDLLEGNHTPSELEARQALSGNLCRCTGYRGVLDAVQEVIAGRRGADADDTAERARIPHQAPPGEGGAQAPSDTVRMPPPRPPNPQEGGPQ